MPIKYVQSTYQFSDPVRFFKANDPYYFEVDNIPLKQLQENCLWLKDQLNSQLATSTSINRVDIEELRPYTTGLDRTVRVKPGRFTARINDASTKEPLAYLQKVFGDDLGETDIWETAFPSQTGWPSGKDWSITLYNALEKFKSTLASDALGMNGLAERAFAWPMVDANTPVDSSGGQMFPLSQNPYFRWSFSNNPGSKVWMNPTILTEALVWYRGGQNTGNPFWSLYNYDTTPGDGAVRLGVAESWFIKKWRGVARLAIVDVEEELTIDVPTFDAEDFSYTDANGTTTPVNGVQSRVDLVFIYSKPVDSSGVKIMKSSSVQTITKPQLGIVRGAGIYTTEEESVNNFVGGLRRETTDDHRILASPGDQNNTDMGFTSTSANDIKFDVRGSFPSPDDILNIAPLLSEKLESNAYELLGQSILPVAYVWVQNTGVQDSAGTVVIDTSDVIDIRPFFRTAELAYNERAGIAAAVPQISLANPVVSRANLDNESNQMYDYVNAQIGKIEGWGPETHMSVLAAGYVYGGFNFGPEGALWGFYKTQNGTDDATTKKYISDKYYGVYAKNPPPDFPDWDMAKWCELGNYLNKGYYPNDFINTFLASRGDPNYSDGSIVGGSFKTAVLPDGNQPDGSAPTRLNKFGSAEGGASDDDVPVNRVQFQYISKTIQLPADMPQWLSEYDVDISFINCMPQTNFGMPHHSDHHYNFPAGYYGHWIEKDRANNTFTIYLSFATRHTEKVGYDNEPDKGGLETPSRNRSGDMFSAFTVPVAKILYSNTTSIGSSIHGYNGNPRIGLCTYPTIQWKLLGIPQGDIQYFKTDLSVNNTILLKQT